jgi:O-antigen ligase
VPSPITPFFVAVSAYFVACLALGGGTRAGFLSDVALQVLAVPLLLWAGWRLVELPPEAGGKRARIAMLVCLLAMAVPMLQLVPLPPALWTRLPGRADFVSNLEIVGLEAGWRPLSMSPRGTWLSALALLPPAAVLLGALQLSYEDRRRLAILFVAFGLVAAGLGLLQAAQGTTSPLRFYAFTNPTEAVGFFANRNHHAALLYCLVPIAAAVSIAAVSRALRASSLRARRAELDLAVAVLGFASVVIFVAAQAIARSRAGLALAFVALLGAIAMTYAGWTRGRGVARGVSRTSAARMGRLLLMAAFGLAVLFGTQMALHRIQDRFASDLMKDGRVPLARNTLEAALAYMPFGSGMGSFVPVYRAFENPTDNFVALINRAHNDYLELWLEAGLIGIVAISLFFVWLTTASVRVWRHGTPGARLRDNLLACAATLILAMLLAHSLVDYPLRTTALMAVFALAVAMLVPPAGALAPAGAPGDADERGKSPSVQVHEREEAHPPSARFSPAAPRSDWPVAWQAKRSPDPRQLSSDRPGSKRVNDPDEGK